MARMLDSVIRPDFPPPNPGRTLSPLRRCLSARTEENARLAYEKAHWAKRRFEQRKSDAALRYELKMESHKAG
jgi:hypothetical protein